ncbi:MAG: hypothetical protein KIT79_11035 [Deltaproteobacteria bacterium]|nr:hypothetical protein [Deltaproteobacteria bacterium]
MTRIERLYAAVGLAWLLVAALLGFAIALFGPELIPYPVLKFHIHAAVLGGILHLWFALLSERMGGLFPGHGAGFTLLVLTHGAIGAFTAGLVWKTALLALAAILIMAALLAVLLLSWRAFLKHGGFRPENGGLRPHAGALLLATGAIAAFSGAAWMGWRMSQEGFLFPLKTAHTMLGVFGGLVMAALSIDHLPSPGDPPHVWGWQPVTELVMTGLAAASAAVLGLYGQAGRMDIPFLMLGGVAVLHFVSLLPRKSSEQITAWAISILLLTGVILLHRFHDGGGEDVRRAAHHAIVTGFVLPLLLGHAFGAAGAFGPSAVASIRLVTGGAGLLVIGFIVRSAGLAGAETLLMAAGFVTAASVAFGAKVFFEAPGDSAEHDLPASRGA